MKRTIYFSCGCNCAGAVSSQGPKGDQGRTGTDGAQGGFGGYSAEWAFSTSTSTGPSATQFRFNNATAASVTSIFVSDTGTGTIDLDAFLDSFSNNSRFGYVRIFKKSDSTHFWMGQVTAVTDNGSDHTLAVTFITSSASAVSGIFVASDALVMSFAEAGFAIPSILYNNTTPSATTVSGAGYTSLKSYTVVANQMKADGDALEVIAPFTITAPGSVNTSSSVTDVKVYFGGTLLNPTQTLSALAGHKYGLMKLRITRVSSTTVFCEFQMELYNKINYLNGGWGFIGGIALVVPDLGTIANLLDIQGQSNLAATLTENSLMVKYYNKN